MFLKQSSQADYMEPGSRNYLALLAAGAQGRYLAQMVKVLLLVHF